jgi:hypothetical protein
MQENEGIGGEMGIVHMAVDSLLVKQACLHRQSPFRTQCVMTRWIGGRHALVRSPA